MKELVLQKRKVGDEVAFFPLSLDDQEKSKAYKFNQPVTVKMKGSKHERSLKQLGTYWACCGAVAENHKQFRDMYEVDDQLRVDLEFYDKNRCRVGADGQLHVFYLSIAVANLEHIEACKYFDLAFDLMALWLGITRKMLIANCTRKQI